MVQSETETEAELAPEVGAATDADQGDEGTAPDDLADRTDEADANVDLAFGAYQRGYYLTALQLALPRAQVGDPAAQTLIAELYASGLGVPLNVDEALSWYRLAAQAGERSAQFALAMYYLDGVAVDKDPARARDLLERAANQDHALAQFNLGQLIVADRPTPAGYGEALQWFRKSSVAGNAEASYSASQIIARGLDGLGERPDDALPFLRDAAEERIIPAQVELGLMLVENAIAGLPTDLPREDPAFVAAAQSDDAVEGYKWLQRAAMASNPLAQNRVAKLRERGIGVERDLVEASMWHILARRGGLQDDGLDRMFARLPQNQRAEALSFANVWPNKPQRDPFSNEDAPPALPEEASGVRDLAPVEPPEGVVPEADFDAE
ncbi:MAG: tetratricopeptide repeat protein [Pseudomonadota bacterium]